MKKSILTLSVLAACATGAASAATVIDTDTTKLSVGGRVEARYQIENDKATGAVVAGKRVFEDEKTDASRVRVNLKGEQKWKDDLTFFGKWEAEFQSKGNTRVDRAMFAGLKGDFGSVSFGRNEPTEGLKMARGMSDMQPYDIVDARNKPKALDGWAGSQLTYVFENDTFGFSAIYALEDEGETTDNQGQAYAASVQYKTPFGLKVGVGYGMGERQPIVGGVVDEDAKAIKENVTYVGAQYQWHDLTVGATYNKQGKDADSKAFEVALKYQVTDELSLGTAYSETEDDDKDVQKAVNVSAKYQFTDAFRGYIGAAVDNAKDEVRTGAESKVRFGVRYDF